MFRALPEQVLQMPRSKTYFISILGTCPDAQEKESSPSEYSERGFASQPYFGQLLLFGAGFRLFFQLIY